MVKVPSCLALTLLGNALFMVAQVCSLFSGDVLGEQSFFLLCCSIRALLRAQLTARIHCKGLGHACLQLPVAFQGLSGAFPWSRGLIPQWQQGCLGSALTPAPDLSVWDSQALSRLKP